MGGLRPDKGQTTRSRHLPYGNTSLRLPITSDFERSALPQSVNRQTMALLDPGLRETSDKMSLSEPLAAIRRLTAILAADVSGYSRLMSANEEGTLTRLKAYRR